MRFLPFHVSYFNIKVIQEFYISIVFFFIGYIYLIHLQIGMGNDSFGRNSLNFNTGIFPIGQLGPSQFVQVEHTLIASEGGENEKSLQ